MIYTTPEEIEAFGPDPVPADATPLDRSRRAMPGADCLERNQQMGRRCPMSRVRKKLMGRGAQSSLTA